MSILSEIKLHKIKLIKALNQSLILNMHPKNTKKKKKNYTINKMLFVQLRTTGYLNGRLY